MIGCLQEWVPEPGELPLLSRRPPREAGSPHHLTLTSRLQTASDQRSAIVSAADQAPGLRQPRQTRTRDPLWSLTAWACGGRTRAFGGAADSAETADQGAVPVACLKRLPSPL